MPRKKKEETVEPEVVVEETVQIMKETEEMLEKVTKEKQDFNEPGIVIFPCPKCGKTKIKRTHHERMIATKYKCSNCGFEGPN